MNPTIKKLKRRDLSPIKPRKLTKQDVAPVVEEIIDQDKNVPSPNEGDANVKVHPEAGKSTMQVIQTNSTVLSKQIKIVTQLMD